MTSSAAATLRRLFLVTSPGLERSFLTKWELREQAVLYWSCKKVCQVVDGLVSLELLDALLKDLDVDTTEDPITWSPTCRKIHAFFEDDELDNWLGDLMVDQRALLPFEAGLLSRLLTFKVPYMADDIGNCPLTVENMTVLTSTAQVKHFWDQLRSAAPREKQEHIARTEWMMSLLVRRFDFIALRVVISCEVWREGTHRGMEFAQIFYQRRTNAGSSDGS
eukprot:symbB.v1.2.010972.t2/scaffold727.1/size198231/17